MNTPQEPPSSTASHNDPPDPNDYTSTRTTLAGEKIRPFGGYVVTVDLDSTLCDTRHRHGMIDPDKVSTDWVAYSLACSEDEPIWPVVNLVLALSRVHSVWIVSGRDIQALDLTLDWLRCHDIDVDGVLLNDHLGDYANHEQYKVARVREVETMTGLAHLFHVDDWPPVAKALDEAGYQCLTVTSPKAVDEFEHDGHLTYV